MELSKDGRRINSNDWSFWAMPEPSDTIAEIAHPERGGKLPNGLLVRLGKGTDAAIPSDTKLVIAAKADQQLAEYVSNGGKALLLSQGNAIEEPENIYLGYTTFRTIPWNGGPGNLGTIISDHPALAAFPHEEACDFQFTWLISKAHPMNFEPLRSTGITPIIRDIDWYRTNKNLAYLMEFKVGSGKVLATSLNILPNLPKRMEAGYLLDCLINYTVGPEFSPAASVSKEQFLKLFSPAPPKTK